MTEKDATKGAPPADMTGTAAEPARKALGRRLLVLRIAAAGSAVAAAAPTAEALEPTPVQVPHRAHGFPTRMTARATVAGIVARREPALPIPTRMTGLAGAAAIAARREPASPIPTRMMARAMAAAVAPRLAAPIPGSMTVIRPIPRGTAPAGGQRRGTGITDADPNDGPGNGRGGSRGRSVSDNDPNDPPGRGRGWR